MPGTLRCFGVQLRAKAQNTFAKLGILVKICLFSWDAEVYFWGICSPAWKMMVIFFTLNELTGWYLQFRLQNKQFVQKRSTKAFDLTVFNHLPKLSEAVPWNCSMKIHSTGRRTSVKELFVRKRAAQVL